MSEKPLVDHDGSPAPAASAAAAAHPAKPHANHGHSPARWTGVAISAVGATIGGIAYPFDMWPVVYIGGALQIVALIVVVAMNAAGYGVPDVWGELKAEAKAKNGGL